MLQVSRGFFGGVESALTLTSYQRSRPGRRFRLEQVGSLISGYDAVQQYELAVRGRHTPDDEQGDPRSWIH